MDKAFFRDFQWMNESKARFTDDALVLYAPEQSDYFFGRYVEADPLNTPGISCRAPFYYTRVTGDFVLRAQVSHDFLYTFDASSIMVMHSLLVWAKACFEKNRFRDTRRRQRGNQPHLRRRQRLQHRRECPVAAGGAGRQPLRLPLRRGRREFLYDANLLFASLAGDHGRLRTAVAHRQRRGALLSKHIPDAQNR